MLNRKYAHWNIAYIKNRLKLFLDERKRPNEPWLVFSSVDFLGQWLSKHDVGLEWGAGRSTLWFADRVKFVTSIEHNKEWFDIVVNMTSDKSNVDLNYCTLDGGEGSSYVNIIDDKIQDNSLDFCLIDGRLRDNCANKIVGKIKRGGIIIIDNIDRYIPSTMVTPNQKDHYLSSEWEHFNEVLVKNWRNVWYSNGVSSTAIWFKPVE